MYVRGEKYDWGYVYQIENGLDCIETRAESGHIFKTILDRQKEVKS